MTFKMNKDVEYLPNPFWRPRKIQVTLEINGTKYGAEFPPDADPEEIGKLVAETVKIATKEPRKVTQEEVELKD